MGGKSSSSNATSSDSTTIDSKQTADGEAVIARSERGDVIVNQTLDEAVQVSEAALDTVDKAVGANMNALDDVLNFARTNSADAYDVQQSALDRVSYSADRALDVVAAGFDQALQESREDTTQLLSQLITFGIPAIVVYLIWRAS